MNIGYNNKTSKPSLDPSVFQSVVWDRLPIGLIYFGDDFKIIFENQKAHEWMPPQESILETIEQGTPSSDVSLHQKAIAEILEGNETPIVYPLRFITKSSNRLLRLTWLAVRDPQSGRIIGGLVCAEDITSEAEYRNQTIHLQRLASIGEVAAKVAHELNNPLDGILRYINLAIRIHEQGQPEKAKDYLLRSRSGLMRMVQILGDMLELSRGRKTQIERSPLDRILRDAIAAMEPGMEKVRVNLSCAAPEPLPLYPSDKLFQVFCNLIKNAGDAMNHDGCLKISVCRRDHFWEVEFQDTGSGFPADQADAIFQPFFTTKDFGRGTGLGLAICRDVVEKLHGRISAVNNPEGGSTFTVRLPIEGEP